jgi:cysteine synthase A
VVSEFASATSQQAMAMVNRLAAEEGLLVGPSSGGACQVAIDIACRDEAAGKTIVVIFPSSGIRYVAHPMWGAEKEECAEILAGPPDISDAPPLLRWKSEDYVPPVKE